LSWLGPQAEKWFGPSRWVFGESGTLAVEQVRQIAEQFIKSLGRWTEPKRKLPSLCIKQLGGSNLADASVCGFWQMISAVSFRAALIKQRIRRK